MDINQISLAKKIWLFIWSIAFIVGGAFLFYKGIHDLHHLWSSIRARTGVIYLRSDIFWMISLPILLIPLSIAGIIKILFNPYAMQVHGQRIGRNIGVLALIVLFAGPAGYFVIKVLLKDIGYQFCGFTDSSRHSKTSAWAYGDKLKCPHSEIFAY